MHEVKVSVRYTSNTYRAVAERKAGTKAVATCTMGEEPAARAAIRKLFGDTAGIKLGQRYHKYPNGTLFYAMVYVNPKGS